MLELQQPQQFFREAKTTGPGDASTNRGQWNLYAPEFPDEAA
jgi:hypothetical protein